MRHHLARLAILALLPLPALAACGDDAAAAAIPAGEVTETRGRLSIADRDTGAVAVWDLDVPAEFTRYALAAPAMLQAPLSRQITAVMAAQPGADRLDVFATGVWIWDHVEHFHVYKEPAARQVDPALAVDAGATALNATGGWIVAFDGTTGNVHALFERSIGDLRTDLDRTRAPVWRVDAGDPHDGFALVARGHLLVSRADGGVDVRPPGAADFGPAAPLEAPCPAPTAAAAVDRDVLIACGDDLLALRWDDDAGAFAPTRVPLPADAPAPAWILAEDDLAPAFVVDGGPGTLALVDTATAATTPVALGAPIVEAAIDRDAAWIAALLDDGTLVILDAATGEETGRVAATGGPGPLAVGDGYAYVGDPEGQAVVEVDLATATITRTFDVGLAPGDLAVTALWPGGEPVQH